MMCIQCERKRYRGIEYNKKETFLTPKHNDLKEPNKDQIKYHCDRVHYYDDHIDIRKVIQALESRDWIHSHHVPYRPSGTLECMDLMEDGPRKGLPCGQLLSIPFERCFYHSKDTTPNWSKKWRDQIRKEERHKSRIPNLQRQRRFYNRLSTINYMTNSRKNIKILVKQNIYIYL
jgi:hypothetical protein